MKSTHLVISLPFLMESILQTMSSSIKSVARIDNQFVYNARYNLSARESKIILFLISRIDPVRQKNLIEQTVSVKELERVLKGDAKRWGGLYAELEVMRDRLVRKGIILPTEIEVEGKRFSGYINWFQHIMPVRDKDGNVALEFLFSQSLQPFLLNLREYVAINFLEVVSLKSGFSIRMFQVFRAHRDRMSKYQKRSVLQYELEDLKGLLGVDGKYSDYRNFRKKVLEVLKKEVNKHTTISVEFKPLKKGRSIAAIQFEFWDTGDRASNPKQLTLLEGLVFEELSFAQLRGFDRLVAYGVNEEVALEMLAKVKGSELLGFEDWYFDEVIRIFESKTNQEAEGAKAGTLVIWFLKMKVFDQNDHTARIMERLQKRKKELRLRRPEAWDNRMMAKGMTWQAFEEKMKA